MCYLTQCLEWAEADTEAAAAATGVHIETAASDTSRYGMVAETDIAAAALEAAALIPSNHGRLRLGVY